MNCPICNTKLKTVDYHHHNVKGIGAVSYYTSPDLSSNGRTELLCHGKAFVLGDRLIGPDDIEKLLLLID